MPEALCREHAEDFYRTLLRYAVLTSDRWMHVRSLTQVEMMRSTERRKVA